MDRLQPQMDHRQRTSLTRAIRLVWSKQTIPFSRLIHATQSNRLTHEERSARLPCEKWPQRTQHNMTRPGVNTWAPRPLHGDSGPQRIMSAGGHQSSAEHIHMLADHERTTRWTICQNFSKVTIMRTMQTQWLDAWLRREAWPNELARGRHMAHEIWRS